MTNEVERRYPHELCVSYRDGAPVKATIEGVEFVPAALSPQEDALREALEALPRGTLWAVGSMEEGPFARLCWPMPGGSYVGGYVEAQGDTPAAALRAAITKGQALASKPGAAMTKDEQ